MTEEIDPKPNTTAQIVMIVLKVLNVRALVLLGLLFDAGFFAWAAATESWMRLATAVIFAIIAWAVVNVKPPGTET